MTATTTPTSGAADLRTAAQAVVDRWDTPLWKDVPATAEYIGRLRAALAAGQATAAQQGAAYAALPTSTRAGRVYEEGFLIGTCPLYTADQLRAFADATHTLRASHGQAPSQAVEYPALVCDYCGALTPDPWHSSGMLHGKMSKHIHSCDACAARGAARAQDTREPLTPERVKEIVRGAGYDQCGIPDTERAAFINGLRHGEREHGIKGAQHGAK